MNKPRVKAKPAPKPAPEYLKSYNPLSEAHAEAVVATAGVELSVQLLDQLKKNYTELGSAPSQDLAQ